MRRSVLGLDRVIAILVGLILFALGAAGAGWYNGGLSRLLPATPQRLSTDGAGDVLDLGWWPWASGAAGALALLLGLWWLLAHIPRAGVGVLVLPGSDRTGRLLIDPATVAGTAAEVLADTQGIRSAHGRVLRDRGELVVAITGTIDPRADLSEIVDGVDAVATTVKDVLGRDDARARIRLSVTRRPHQQPRVR